MRTTSVGDFYQASDTTIPCPRRSAISSVSRRVVDDLFAGIFKTSAGWQVEGPQGTILRERSAAFSVGRGLRRVILPTVAAVAIGGVGCALLIKYMPLSMFIAEAEAASWVGPTLHPLLILVNLPLYMMGGLFCYTIAAAIAIGLTAGIAYLCYAPTPEKPTTPVEQEMKEMTSSATAS